MAYQDRHTANPGNRRRTNRNVLVVVGAIIATLCLCGGCGAIFGNESKSEQPATTTTRATTPPPSSTAPSTPPPTSTTTQAPPPPNTGTLAPPVEQPETTRQAPVAEPEPAPSPVPAPPPPPAPEPEWTPEPTVDLPPAPSPNVYYSNCSEARAAGAAPLYVGEPGYRPKLDRDNDGVACE